MTNLPRLSRRDLLRTTTGAAAAALAPISVARAGTLPGHRPATAGTRPLTPHTPSTDAPDQVAAKALAEVERRHGLRIGVQAVNHRTGRSLGYRADERFAFCSVYKGLLAAELLHRHGGDTAYLNRVVHYDGSALIEGDFVTQLFVETGMTVRALCQAMLSYSDNVAANLLFELTGGPAALTRYLRSIGDTITDCNRNEPSVNTAVPGQIRDTTTPRAIAADFSRLLLGDVLPESERTLLRIWMEGDEVNLDRFRAGLPQDWLIADKTGTGDYGVANDVGVVWTGDGTPLTIAVMTTATRRDATTDQAAVAAVTRIAARRIAPGVR